MILQLIITYLILLQTYSQICGNGNIEGTEQCDDGNSYRYDGCYECQIETGYSCAGQPSFCTKLCGNGQRDPQEQCDDGNYINGDGCSSECQIEQQWECAQQNLGPDLCQLICGDGVLNTGEECDDGNYIPGDGCFNCKIEFAWTCNPQSVCTKQCGDGIIQQWEQCDDGNTIPNDGCSNCLTDWGYNCTQPNALISSVCVQIADVCGDGYRTKTELCEDGNLINGDGCNSNCIVENGWNCIQGVNPYSNTICSPICGDGIIVGSEECDDNNTINGDGCSSTCLIETYCGNGKRNQYKECDDGNTQSGDGCSSECKIEIGWSCNLIKGSSRDQCSLCVYQCESCVNSTISGCVKCYPGYVKFELSQRCEPHCPTGFYRNDELSCQYCPQGCSQCLSTSLGQCTSCSSGYYLYQGNCQENCQEGYFGQNNAVYGNVCQQCFKPCTICTGALICTACEKKYYLDDNQQCQSCDMDEHCLECNKRENQCLICDVGYTPDGNNCKTVPSICGDGKRYFSEECDDGNLINNDGCSSQCQIEQGWNCVIQINSADQCYKLVPLDFITFIDSIHFDTLYIEFTRPLNNKFWLYNFTELIEVNIPTVDYFKVNMKLEQLDLLSLRFEFNSTILNKIASIKVLQPTVIVDKYNWTLVGNQNDLTIQTKTYPTKSAILNYFIYYTSDEYDFAQTLGFILIFINLGSLLVSLNYTRKFGEGKQWKIIESFQLLSLMRFLNFRYSLHVQVFLQYLNIYSLSFVPNLFSFFGETTINITTMREMPPNFIIQQFSPSFLLNAGGILLSLFIYLFTLQSIIPYEPLEDIIREVLDYFHWQIYIRLFEIMFFEVALSIFVNFSYGQLIQGIDLASFVFSILTCLFCFVLVGTIIKFVIIPDATSNLWLHQKAQCLYDGINLRTRIGKKLLIVMTLVIIINPLNQVIIIVCLRIVVFTPCFKYNPFTNKLVMIREIMNEIMNVICYVSTLTFINYYDTKQEKQTSSWILALMIVINSLAQGIWNFSMYFFQNSFKPPDYLIEQNNPDESKNKPNEYVSKLRQLRVQRKKDVAQEIEDLKILEQQKQLKDEAIEQLKEKNLDDFFNDINVK